MLRVQRDHDARKLGPLALVNRQYIRQRRLVEVGEVVFDGSTLEIDDQLNPSPWVGSPGEQSTAWCGRRSPDFAFVG